jgi:hypothetical protein
MPHENLEAASHILAVQVEVDGKSTELLKRRDNLVDGNRRIAGRRENLLPEQKKEE